MEFAASIITLAESARLLIGLLHQFEEAPVQISTTIDRISILISELDLLVEMQTYLEKADFETGRYILLLVQCQTAMTTICTTLARIVRPGRSQRIRWVVMGHSQARDLTNELAHLEIIVALITSLTQWYSNRIVKRYPLTTAGIIFETCRSR